MLNGLVFRVKEFLACPMFSLSDNTAAFLRELFVNCPQYDGLGVGQVVPSFVFKS